MAQRKLQRFEAIKFLPNVLQYPEGMAGHWNDFFKNSHPITLELACGKGEYTIGLAELFPTRNFIGVDIKGNRIYVGAKKSIEDGRSNVAFLRTDITQIAYYFSKDEVNEIWLTFPDPQLRNSRAKKRLTHPRFLRLYQQFLVPGGKIHLKTDSPLLFDFTMLVIGMYGLTLHESIDDVYTTVQISKELEIKTHYEKLDIARSKRVHYLCFSLTDSSLPLVDHILHERIKKNADQVG